MIDDETNGLLPSMSVSLTPERGVMGVDTWVTLKAATRGEGEGVLGLVVKLWRGFSIPVSTNTRRGDNELVELSMGDTPP